MEKKRFVLAYRFSLSSREIKAGPWKPMLWPLLTIVLSMMSSATFFIQPRPICPGKATFTMGWALLHQLQPTDMLNRSTWWRQFFSRGPLFQGMSSWQPILAVHRPPRWHVRCYARKEASWWNQDLWALHRSDTQERMLMSIQTMAMGQPRKTWCSKNKLWIV